MAFFTYENGEPIAPFKLEDEMRALVERHVAFVDKIMSEVEPGLYGVDFQRARIDAEAIKAHRKETECQLIWLLEKWQPEFDRWPN